MFANVICNTAKVSPKSIAFKIDLNEWLRHLKTIVRNLKMQIRNTHTANEMRI